VLVIAGCLLATRPPTAIEPSSDASILEPDAYCEGVPTTWA
jgi:hypothetical protein